MATVAACCMSTLATTPGLKCAPRLSSIRAPVPCARSLPLRLTARRQPCAVRAEETSTAEVAGAAAGLVAIPVVAWSLYTLKTTGSGLPPGPGGALGAVEGVSYLLILGLVGWSVYTKTTTGKGLPNGPFGLLGAAEGLSYLTLLAAALVFALQATGN